MELSKYSVMGGHPKYQNLCGHSSKLINRPSLEVVHRKKTCLVNCVNHHDTLNRYNFFNNQKRLDVLSEANSYYLYRPCEREYGPLCALPLAYPVIA